MVPGVSHTYNFLIYWYSNYSGMKFMIIPSPNAFFFFCILRSWEHCNLEHSTTEYSTTQHKNYGTWILVMFALFYVGSKLGFSFGGDINLLLVLLIQISVTSHLRVFSLKHKQPKQVFGYSTIFFFFISVAKKLTVISSSSSLMPHWADCWSDRAEQEGVAGRDELCLWRRSSQTV